MDDVDNYQEWFDNRKAAASTLTDKTVMPSAALSLRVPSANIELRITSDLGELLQLAKLGARGIQHPSEHFLHGEWSGLAPVETAREIIKWDLTHLIPTPKHWVLHFTVLRDGRAIGKQSLHGTDYSVTRACRTGSWLAREEQGRGAGVAMRCAVVMFAFQELSAHEVGTEAEQTNERSIRVSQKMGYESDGFETVAHGEVAMTNRRFRITRERWLEKSPSWPDVEISGVTPELLEVLGAAQPK
jgi:RimJ/RimL family protein N-acetyltransferase